MAALSDNVGILLKIKADSSDARVDIAKFKTELKAIEKAAKDQLTPLQNIAAQSGLTAEQFTKLKTGATLAAGAIASVAAGAVAASVALFEITKATAEYGSAIFDATEKTGLSAEALSSMKIAADQSSTSLEAVTAGMAKFAKVIGSAEKGDGTAVAALAKLHVTSKDLDTALSQALTTIAKYPPGVEQMTAAQAAFGRSGVELLPFIKSFDGDLPGFIAKCKELGLTMSDQDARAADAFGDQMDTLNAQMAAVGRIIGMELMPIFMDMAVSISGWLSENKTEIRVWADATIEALRLVAEAYRATLKGAQLLYALSETSKGNVFPLTQFLEGEQRPRNQVEYSTGEPGTYEAAPRPRPWGSTDLNIPQKQVKAAKDDTERLEREAYERRIASYRREEAEKIAISEELLAVQKNNLRLGVISEEQMAQYKIAIENKLLQNRIDTLKKERVAAEEHHQETLDLDSQIKIAEQDLTTKKVADEQVKYDLMDKRLERELNQTRELLRLEDERRQHSVPTEGEIPFSGSGGSVFDTPEAFGIQPQEQESRNASIQGAIDKWNALKEAMQGVIGVQTIIGQTGGMVIDLLINMASAVGSAVEGWALYGESIGKALRKALAAQLAHIAAVATVHALYATALGFLRLAQWDFAGAAHAFLSAGLWAALAVGTAQGARSLAGNAFKQQTGAASGQTTGGYGNGSSQGGTVYSGQQGSTVYSGGNTPSRVAPIRIELGLNSQGVLEVLKSSANRNGGFRDLVLDIQGA